MRIALDAMGGDRARPDRGRGASRPSPPTPTCASSSSATRPRSSRSCRRGRPARPARGRPLPPQVVGMDEKPVEALRKKPDNSIARCWQLLAEQQGGRPSSAPATPGRWSPAGCGSRRFLKGVRRPGIATVMPTAKGPCVIIDVGANVHPKPRPPAPVRRHGRPLRPHILGRRTPDDRADERRRGGGQGPRPRPARPTPCFRNSPLATASSATSRAATSTSGACDVIVTDGFVGNVVLKLLRRACSSS